MENRRTETARENDDSDIIDRIEATPSQGGSSGGNLQEDIATQAELDRAATPKRMTASTSRTRSTTSRNAIPISRRTSLQAAAHQIDRR